MGKTPRRKRVAVAWLAAVTLCTACAASEDLPGGDSPSTPRTPKLGAIDRGLYGFDGTNTKAKDNSVIYTFVDAAAVGRKQYFEGTTFFAENYQAIVDRGVAQICQEDAKRPFAQLYLLGYSRGGVAALEVAARVAKECARPVPVTWLGLVDTVATSVESSLRIGNAREGLATTQCLHLVKSHERLPFLGTADVLSCPSVQVEADHLQMAGSTEVAARLRADVERIAPDFFEAAR